MNKIATLITRHGFIFATSIAMFVHSTWTFNTLFAGEQPTLDGSLSAWVPYLLWVTPGALIAAAIDIGQVQTSSKLMRAKTIARRGVLLVTFMVLAIAGYYLQWFHLVHHMPALDFGRGLSPEMQSSVIAARDYAIFIIPMLLPISTILYTVSEIGEHDEHTPAVPDVAPVVIEVPDIAQLPDNLPADDNVTEYTALCEHCGWSREYDSPESMQRGLNAHQSRHCPGLIEERTSANGVHA